MSENLLETHLTRSGRIVEIVRENSGYRHVLWRCSCGQRSDWRTATDEVAPAAEAARTHATNC